MKLSKPKEYIDILLSDMTKIFRVAYTDYYEQKLFRQCPNYALEESLKERLLKAETLKIEIKEIIDSLQSEEYD